MLSGLGLVGARWFICKKSLQVSKNFTDGMSCGHLYAQEALINYKIIVIASAARQSQAMESVTWRLPRHFVPRNDELIRGSFIYYGNIFEFLERHYMVNKNSAFDLIVITTGQRRKGFDECY